MYIIYVHLYRLEYYLHKCLHGSKIHVHVVPSRRGNVMIKAFRATVYNACYALTCTIARERYMYIVLLMVHYFFVFLHL